MLNLNINHLIRKLNTDNTPIVLFGAGKYGKMAFYALKKFGLNIQYFCDDYPAPSYLDIPVISLSELKKIDNNCHIFICTGYALRGIISRLDEIEKKNRRRKSHPITKGYGTS